MALRDVALPPQGSTNWYSHYSSMHSAAVTGENGVDTGIVDLDTFAGANDSAKLSAAMSYAAAQTYKPTIRFRRGNTVLTETINTMYRGFKITGSGGDASIEQPRAQDPYSSLVTFTKSGSTLFSIPNARYDGASISNIAWRGNSTSTFMARGSSSYSSSQLATGAFTNLGFDGWKHVFGTPSNVMLFTSIHFDGYWNINAGWDTAITIGGSDNNFWLDQGLLLDSSFSTFPANTPHAIFNYLDMTYIGPIYMTCEPTFGGLLITSGQNRMLTFWGGLYGGRQAGDDHAYNTANTGKPLIDITGQCYTNMNSVWFGYSKGTTSMPILRVRNGARVAVRDPYYKPPTNPTANQLFAGVDGSGSELRISGVWDMGITPRATATNSGKLVVDSTVTVV